MMAVLPQISEGDAVVLNVRPTISRRLTDVADPNPALANPADAAGVTTCDTGDAEPDPGDSRRARSNRCCACRAGRPRCSAA